MKFGAVPPREAEGAVAVHSIRKNGMVLKKGTSIGKTEIAALEAAQVGEIVVARLEPGDVSEDVAAAEIAAAVAGEGVHVDRAFTGRANLFAENAGVLVVDKAGVDALNDVDPAITFATLNEYAAVVAGKMIATVKIIPFAVSGQARDKAVDAARAAKPIVRVAPFKIAKVGIISTVLPGLADKVRGVVVVLRRFDIDLRLGFLRPLLGPCQPLLQLADAGEIFIDLVAIVGAEGRLHRLGLILHHVEDALAVAQASRLRLYLVRPAFQEQPREHTRRPAVRRHVG